ncbi:MAG: hypothetical protein H6737_13645 [Alphaproteobacteria bacterium]|nr:hypothetical protein [Alphaproteobacteria bacterium]
MLLGGVCADVAYAGKKDAPVALSGEELAAERYRLEQEMDKLAKKTQWTGVERTYAQMLELQTPLTTHTHYTAALAAEARGDMRESWIRLERALREQSVVEMVEPDVGFSIKKTLPEVVDTESESGQAARAAYEQLRTRYGRVGITVHKTRLPALALVSAKPFSKTEREAIERAQKALSVKYEYEGLLPLGRYMIDGEFFEVAPGEIQKVRVEKH